MQLITRNFTQLWIIFTLLLLWEYCALNGWPEFSLFYLLKQSSPSFSEWNLSTEAGRPISYYLGWAGFIVMATTNLYILRKRVLWMQNWGRVRNWLEFHIFCGMLGPTLIIFHTDFKVGGLVAISFWSMMIVAISGVLGRYFYMQVLSESADLQQEVIAWEQKVQRVAEKSGQKFSNHELVRIKNQMLNHVGVVAIGDSIGALTLINITASSIVGDVRLIFPPPRIGGLSPRAVEYFRTYALAVRREVNMTPFKRLLGYWHAFHVPFTIVMYITALIHIFVVLMFQVK